MGAVRMFSKKGITLSELLIAMLIVSVMMVGIVSTDRTIHRMDRDMSREGALFFQTQAIGEQIRQAALRATGDKTNPGIEMFMKDNEDNFICFRHDDEANPTPAEYSDDTWQCFSFVRTAAPNAFKEIGSAVYACQNGTPSTCNPLSFPGAPEETRIIGRLTYANCNNYLPPTEPLEAPSFDLTTGIFHMQLIGRRDPEAGPAIKDGQFTTGTDDNPQVVLTIDVSPEAHSH